MGHANVSRDWREEFEAVQQSEFNHQSILVQHKRSHVRYQMFSISISDEVEKVQLQKRLEKRKSVMPKYITHLQKICYKEEQNICGSFAKFQLIYEQSQLTLQNHFNYRKELNKGFSDEQILYVIYSVCLGLKDIEQMSDRHGQISLKTVFVGSSVRLQDPIIIQIKTNSKDAYRLGTKEGYPSPNKLLNKADSGMNLDEFRQDLFSLGILALQLYYCKQDIKQIYKVKSKSYQNERIDQGLLCNYIQKVNNQCLRNWVKILVGHFPNERIKIYNQIRNFIVPNKNLNFITIAPKVKTPEEQLAEEMKPQNYIQPHDPRYPRPQLSFSKVYAQKRPLSHNVRIQAPTSSALTVTTLPTEMNPISIPANNVRLINNKISIPKYVNQVPMRNPIINVSPSRQFIQPTKIIRPVFHYKSPQKQIKMVHPNIMPRVVNESIGYFKQQPQQIRMVQSLTYKAQSKPQSLQYKINYIPTSNPQPKPQPPVYKLQYKFELKPQFKAQPKSQSNIERKVETKVLEYKTDNKFELKQQQIQITQIQLNQNMQKQKIKYSQIKRSKAKAKATNKQLTALQEQYAALQKIAKQNQKLQNKMRYNSQNLFQNLSIPSHRQTNVEAPGQESRAEQPQFVSQEYESGNKYEGFKVGKMRNGYGKFYYNGGSLYDGQWIDNKMNGYGVLFYPDGAIAYQGEWKNDYFDGKGAIFNDVVQLIEGSFDYHDFKHLQSDQWKSYQGQIKQDKRHGRGKLLLSNGQLYQGQFYNDNVHGQGEFRQLKGHKIKGIWSDGILRTIIY